MRKEKKRKEKKRKEKGNRGGRMEDGGLDGGNTYQSLTPPRTKVDICTEEPTLVQ
jgi:hypothetical protein